MTQIRLSQPVRSKLIETIFGSFDELALQDLLAENNQDLDAYTSGSSPRRKQVRDIVAGAEREGWLSKLVHTAVSARPNSQALQSLCNEINKLASFDIPDGFQPTEICCLSGDRIMINRSLLRSYIDSLKAPNGKRILIVGDDCAPRSTACVSTRSGKTLTLHFISTLSQITEDFAPFFIDLNEYQERLGIGVEILPMDLAKRLAIKLDYGDAIVPASPSDLQWSRWSIEFFDRFEAKARGDMRQIWIVIDEFNKVTLPQATLDFVKGFAQRLKFDFPRFRLVLLGYRDTLAHDLADITEKETVSRSISEKDLITFFVVAAKQRFQQLDQAMLAELTVNVLSKIDKASEAYMEDLARVARGALDQALAEHAG